MLKTQLLQKQNQDLDKYAGKWVAVIDDQVIDSSENFNELIQKISQRKLGEQPAVFLVPRKDEGPYIL